MKLTRLFAVSIALLAVLIGAMPGRMLWDEWCRAVRDGGALPSLALSLLLLMAHRRALRPLSWVTRALVKPDDGDLVTEVRGPERRDESGVLLRAGAAARQ